MNSTPQIDLHPGAENLNAFAEQTLAAPERERILAHLAVCSRCRQVIFLAQNAAAEAEKPARVAAAQPATQPGAWFNRWRVVWLPAAALATAMMLLVVFYPRPAARMPELAKATPPSEPAPLTRTLQEQPGAGGAPRPAVHEKSAARYAKSTELSAPPGEPAYASAPSAALPVEPGTSGFSNEEADAALSPPGASGSAIATMSGGASFQPEPAVTAWQQEQHSKQRAGALATNSDAAQASQKKMRERETKTQASRAASVAAAMPRSDAQSASAGSFDLSAQERTAAPARNETKSIQLPSGLTAVSTATAQNRTLAIDLEGALFLSDDAGKHWEPVARQWTGRALEVRTRSGAGGALFQISIENGSTWASADGRIWTAQ